MALTEKQVVDKIEVVENGNIQIRTATVIERDGVEISRTFHRHVRTPLDSFKGEDAKVQDIAKAVHTKKVVAQAQKIRDDKMKSSGPQK